MTKAELVKKGKTLGLNLSEKSLKVDLEKAVAKAEKSSGKATTSPKKANGEY
jgi:hypothetical protein